MLDVISDVVAPSMQRVSFLTVDLADTAVREWKEKGIYVVPISKLEYLVALMSETENLLFEGSKGIGQTEFAVTLPWACVEYVLENVYAINAQKKQFILPVGTMERSNVFFVNYGVNFATHQLDIALLDEKGRELSNHIRIAKRSKCDSTSRMKWHRPQGTRISLDLGDKVHFIMPVKSLNLQKRFVYEYTATLL